MATEKKEVRDVSRTIQTKGWIKNLLWIGLAIIIIAIIINSFGGGNGASSFRGYSKTFELEVATLEPHKLCGVPPGEHTFVVPKGREIEVFIQREKTDITSALRVNQTLPGETFSVGDDSCVIVSFAVNANFQRNAFDRQVIAITFK
ncbi:MAG: hypothetical protein PHH40_04405 [Candidatus Moranbacteria bacterium]|nr:hypothetical protein [Candidatus Moranbacteria bacterium]MDD3964522.1 hypothetical protein [Candidatus Moranbacteria bacterium]